MKSIDNVKDILIESNIQKEEIKQEFKEYGINVVDVTIESNVVSFNKYRENVVVRSDNKSFKKVDLDKIDCDEIKCYEDGVYFIFNISEFEV